MLEKILESYKKNKEFIQLMNYYDVTNTLEKEAMGHFQYRSLETWRKRSSEKHLAPYLLGLIGSMLRHPIKTITANQYYFSKDFGKFR